MCQIGGGMCQRGIRRAGPDGEHKGQAGQFPPGRAQIDLMGVALPAGCDDLVADQQECVGIRSRA
jgi:hypothetical protein